MNSAQSIFTDLYARFSVLSSSRREYKWPTENEAREQHLGCQFYSVLLCMLQSNPMRRRTFGPLKLQTGWQWAKVSSCPDRTTNIHSLSFLHVSPHPLASSLLCTPSPHPPLRPLAEFRMDLRLPGHLGWWSPLPQGLGRPLGLLLEGGGGKSVKDVCILLSSKVVWHCQQWEINLLSGSQK